MKFLIIALAISSQAFAGTPIITAKQVTCDELQQFINDNREVYVRVSVLGVPFKKRVSITADCRGRLQYTSPAFFKTKDESECYAGETCKYERVPSCGEAPCSESPDNRPGYYNSKYKSASGNGGGEFDNYTTPSGPGYYGN